MWTEQELDEYESAHRIDPDHGCNIMGCDAGEGVPPCRVADLVAEVRRLQAALEKLETDLGWFAAGMRDPAD